MNIKSFLKDNTNDSAMRLGLLIIVVNTSIVCLTICFISVYTMVSSGDFKNVSDLIQSFAFFVTGLLGPISIGKSIQSFGERDIYNPETMNKTDADQASQTQ